MTAGDTRFVSRLTRETLALVMAGGRGSRLMQLTSARAKPAVPFGGKFRIIDFTLSNCINSGIRRIGVLTQYKSQSLIRPLQTGWSFLRGQFGEFVELLPAEQRSEIASWYSGTADAVYQNLEFIKEHQPAYVLVLAGDHVYKMDYGRMLAHHASTGAMLTVGCLEVPLDEARSFGVMQIDNSTRVLRFDEKPKHPEPLPGKPDRALASMGIYVFDALFLLRRLMADAGVAESSHDFGKDIVPNAIKEGSVYAYPFTDLYDSRKQGYWRDVGTIDAYWQANLELVDVQPELNLYDNDWPIWTHQLQAPPAKFVFDEPNRRGSAIDSMVAGGCIVSGAQVIRSVLFSNVRVESGSHVEKTLLLPNVTVGRNCRIRNAIIDEGCVIPDDTVIGENPERDRKLFHLSEGGVTLVTREMLLS
ncbi:glucose-1-phosphate adenylyltransferase [Solimonas aquatica]|uniref:Glucose-1-phosphate adenylyltransferase n=1 Tax=Solimonas aquatica TaxID=489703 RepID=A0A1H9DJ38_9GAMM|nr:glucose-1-phosphate adenylyltransferase [Solimonas aquatica]SEQ13337.1 glucose-1-phosphate adenylyltransferase [Solimonas aquatica]